MNNRVEMLHYMNSYLYSNLFAIIEDVEEVKKKIHF